MSDNGKWYLPAGEATDFVYEQKRKATELAPNHFVLDYTIPIAPGCYFSIGDGEPIDDSEAK